MVDNELMEKVTTLRNVWDSFVGVDCLNVRPEEASEYLVDLAIGLNSSLRLLDEGDKTEKEWITVECAFGFVMGLLLEKGVISIDHENAYIIINDIMHPMMLAFVPYAFAKEDKDFFKKKYKVWLSRRYIGTIEYGDEIAYNDLDPEFLTVGFEFKFDACPGYEFTLNTSPTPNKKIVVLATDAFDERDYDALAKKLDNSILIMNITIKEEHKAESAFAKGLPDYQATQLAKADLVYVGDYVWPEFWEKLIRRYNEHAEIMFPKENRKIEIVTLCGSLRFKNNILNIKTELESYGCMVLVPNMGARPDPTDEQLIRKLHIAHYRKMDQSNHVIIVNRDGYIGDDTQREIDYCYLNNIPVIYAYEYNDEVKQWEMVLSKEMLGLD